MKYLFCLAVLVSCLCSGCASDPVTSLALGQQVNFQQLQDQNGNDFTHQNAMKLVLYVGGMSGKDLVRESLDTINTACLTQGQVVYVADISGMPSLISKLIAIPKMRDYPYPIWLDRNGQATEALPVKENAVTVLSVDQQLITGIDYFAGVPTLSKRLVQNCGAANQWGQSH